MNYSEALDYIHSTPRFSRKPSLNRIRDILACLGDPQKELRFIHIAGTNGKGSVAAMTAAVLQAAGYRTGLFTSPYLQRFNERMRINDVCIPDNELARVTERVRDAEEARIEAGKEPLNEFELITAIGLCWFREKQAELVVLEVGLGGRYDATNVIESPLACAITSISLDHTAVLGNTPEEIAGEKAGIIKAGCPVVISPDQTEGVRAVLSDAAKKQGAPVLWSERSNIRVLRHGTDGLDFLWRGRRLHLPLLGHYQEFNLCTVLAIIDALQMREVEIPQTAIEAGLANVQWPGRLELLNGRFLLDCGHNPAGIKALCEELDKTFADRELVVVMGMLRDKDYHGCIREVAARAKHFFAAAPPSPRALTAEEIAEAAGGSCASAEACPSIEEALERGEAALNESSLLVVCGSIPLVGACRDRITDKLSSGNDF